MPFIWDYDINKLKKTKSGRLLILERQINYGIYPSDKEKIDLKEVKKHWHDLNLEPSRKRLFEFLIWGK
ncbi:hypothetical protein HY383_01880 [Candidatus Daviesbacteria bacterium]|nr:hypothetical protein [Candidatus Daviesbacteria bacterium]